MWLQVSDRGQAVCKSLLAIPPGAWDTLMEAHMYLARVPGSYHLYSGKEKERSISRGGNPCLAIQADLGLGPVSQTDRQVPGVADITLRI